MKKAGIIVAVMLWAVSITWGASARAYVNDENVVEGNSVNLILEAVGENIEFPDPNTIAGFPVEGKSRMSSVGISIVNGQSRTEKTNKLILSFTPTKPVEIPSFSIKVDGQVIKTKPIRIKLVKSAAPVPGQNAKYSLDMVANKQEVYVGEPLLLSVFFNESRQADLMDVKYQPPVLNDFFVKDAGDEKTYRKGDYIVHELRYIITPKHEGNLTIAPAHAKVAERSRRRDDFFGTFFATPRWSQITSNSLKIVVKPLPRQTDLVGDLKLEDEVDAVKVKANKPVNLTIRISGEGNLEDFEGPKYDIDGVTVYSDDAKVESQISGNQLLSTFVKKYVFIADHDFTIPSRSFTLFNYKTGKVETLQTKAYHIEVRGGHTSAPVIQSATPQTGETAAASGTEKSGKTTSASIEMNPWLLLLAFASGILFAVAGIRLLPKLTWKRKINPMKEGEALKILYPHINEDPEVEEIVRKLYARKGGDRSVKIDKERLKRLIGRYR